MTKLNEIPVHIELSTECISNESISGESISMLLPILHELVAMHKSLISSGQNNIIDLRHEPLEVDEIAALKELLGQGEITVNLKALGSTIITETSISGVWWITHYNQEGNILSEFIEITTCPEMLKTFPGELEPALIRLQDKLTQYAHTSTPGDIAKRLNELGFNSNNVLPSNLN